MSFKIILGVFLVAQWVKDLTVVIAVARVAGVVRV